MNAWKRVLAVVETIR